MIGKYGKSRIGRRQVLQGTVLAAASTWIGNAAQAQRAAGRTAVVFLSRSSNTRMLASDLSRRLGADLLEVRPRDPWPEDYEEMVAWATRWRESRDLLPLEGSADISGSDTVYLGFPIWGGALPAPMRSFLSGHDLSGKSVLPFITHGGYGVGSAIEEVRSLAPNSRFTDPFVLQCDQERDNLNALQGWLNGARNERPR